MNRMTHEAVCIFIMGCVGAGVTAADYEIHQGHLALAVLAGAFAGCCLGLIMPWGRR